MDDLRDVIHFVAVAREGSFVRAAHVLGVPTSTISRRVAEHEKAIGAKLFTRTTRRVNLTEAGRVYLTRCEQIVEAARAAREEILEINRNPRGLLRISMSQDFGTTFMAPVIAAFHKHYPEIEIQLDLSSRRVDMAAEGFDLAIRIGAPGDASLVARRLVMLRRGLYASPDFLKDHPPISRPIELATLPCLLIGPAADAHRWMLRSGTSVEEVDIKGPISCNTPGMVLQLATAGLGIAVIDATMASAYVRRKELKPVLTDWEVSPSPIYVVAPGKIETLKVRLFVDHLHRSLRNFATRSED